MAIHGQGVQYGKTHIGSSYTYYPNLYVRENGSGIDTETVKTDGIKNTDKGYNALTEETSSQASSKLTVTQTYYEVLIDETNYGESAKVLCLNDSYWVASRFVDTYSADGSSHDFGLCCANLSLSGLTTFSAGGEEFRTFNKSYLGVSLRPVVTLGPNVQLELTEEGTNSAKNPHTIKEY